MALENASPVVDLESPEALRVFFRIAQAWGLSRVERLMLLGVDEITFAAFEAGELTAKLDDATTARLSHIFAIYSALQVLLPIPERADAWIKQPNSAPLFGGARALDRMVSGQFADLALVRQYLDAQLYA
ncbi:MbcA/ParS/Xre antitoxin family protein [Lysobacter auxotrophicus]|uniref:MbcA/ParS/Xre antitoxin family protein n=1 Tax=Lysobacter auxotrophicus TaxID=2992573 RepID=A0ABN6UP87_9GAMM|nr:MbcA/ParS/Xre antitoxin family protein [Lysobacter auxotrophicus]BDU18106.1 MbcA/ParS/Xre antitoxin family protein [Lysobacter auxotrophicus]